MTHPPLSPDPDTAENQRRLQETLTLQNAILSCVGVGILAANKSGIITSINQTAEVWLGYQSFEMVGQMSLLAVHDPQEIERRAAELSLETGHPVQPGIEALLYKPMKGLTDDREWTYVAKDGRRRPVQLTVTAIVGASAQIDGYLAVAYDITERQAHDRAMKLALDEKETLLKEVYHRVKNNLQVVTSLFNLQLRQTTDASARHALKEGAERVRAMALVHEKLYQSSNLSSIDLRDYIQDLCQQLSAGAGATERGIRLTVDAASTQVGLETAVPLGLLLNELITNSLKHAFPDGRQGAITISVQAAAQGQCQVAVRDNGIGMPDAEMLSKSRSLGVKLLKTLAGQIDASLALYNDNGAVTTLTFPVRHQTELQHA